MSDQVEDQPEPIAAMPNTEIKRALIAVYDKTGVAEFAKALVEEFGVEIISTGGTARHLREAGLPVTMVEEVTGFPEMLDGRVKTLHPRIHAAILADRDNPDHMRQLAEHGIQPIDMVVVNLYPFEKTIARPDCTFEEAIEMIDIGGPCLLRAAAKNHRQVVPVAQRRSQDYVLKCLRETGNVPAHGRAGLARIVYETTAGYDEHLHDYFAKKGVRLHEMQQDESFAASGPGAAADRAVIRIRLHAPQTTRYGENPHQEGRVARLDPVREPVGVSRGGEVEMSFNNYLDASAALELCRELTRAGTAGRPASAVCFIKHTNACGAAVRADQIEAYRRAYLGDPNAAMGGILAVNFDVTAPFAETVMETYARWGKAAGAGGFFVEVWIAPSFDEKAVRIIRGEAEGAPRKDWGKRVRLLAAGDMSLAPDPDEMDCKRIAGGMLMQTRDLVGLNEEQWQVVTQRAPTDGEMDDLRLAWLVCKHTKSNAITLCREGMLIGNGAGQMSRVMSCRIATWLARENGHADKLPGAVAASDAFFPFSDGPGILMDAGVTAIIQPGGSKRDEDTIKACDERGVAMIFTGTRHFRH